MKMRKEHRLRPADRYALQVGTASGTRSRVKDEDLCPGNECNTVFLPFGVGHGTAGTDHYRVQPPVAKNTGTISAIPHSSIWNISLRSTFHFTHIILPFTIDIRCAELIKTL
jgi:hypothetical protein